MDLTIIFPQADEEIELIFEQTLPKKAIVRASNNSTIDQF